MTMTLEQLEQEALCLDLDTRAHLAERLLLSLEAPSEEENLALWVSEAERRLDALRQGQAKEVDADEALRRARAALG